MPVIDHGNKSRIILNAESSTPDETFTIDLPAITLQHGLFRYCLKLCNIIMSFNSCNYDAASCRCDVHNYINVSFYVASD